MKHIVDIKDINIKKYTKFFEDHSSIDQDEAMHSLILVLFYQVIKYLTEVNTNAQLSIDTSIDEELDKYFFYLILHFKDDILPTIILTLDWRQHGIFVSSIVKGS